MRRSTVAFVGLAVLLGLVVLSDSGYGGVLYSESFTGAQLATDPQVLFPSRQPVVQGTSLFFGPGNIFREKLFVLPLVPEDTLSGLDPTVVSISMRLTRQEGSQSYPEDHDPTISVGDGSKIIGFVAGDNLGGEGAVVFYNDMGIYGEEGQGGTSFFTNAGYPAIGQTLDIQTRFTLLDTSSEVYGAFGSESGSLTFGQTLNRNRAISLVFMAHDNYEQYKIESLSVEVQGTIVPEPSTLVLFGVGAIGLVAWVWRRQPSIRQRRY